MRLSALLDALPPHLAPQLGGAGEDDPIIRGVTYDSRGVSPGDLFVALRGENHDGHEYLAQASKLGAAALLVETTADEPGARERAARVPHQERTLDAPHRLNLLGARDLDSIDPQAREAPVVLEVHAHPGE